MTFSFKFLQFIFENKFSVTISMVMSRQVEEEFANYMNTLQNEYEISHSNPNTLC